MSRSRNAFLTDERMGNTPTLQRAGFPLDSDDRMTMNGVISATGMLFALLLTGAAAGWLLVDAPGDTVRLPGWIMGLTALGFVLVIAFWIKPGLAKIIGPAYALIEGVIVGAFSHAYHVAYDGIVVQAVLATIGIFGAMLFMYKTEMIKVTAKFRKIVIGATMAIMAMYVIQFVSQLFGDFSIPFLHDSGPIGILISLAIIAVASFNYLLDFDFIERSIAAGAPRNSEWVGAFALLITTVWLYFEMLRLLSKLND